MALSTAWFPPAEGLHMGEGRPEEGRRRFTHRQEQDTVVSLALGQCSVCTHASVSDRHSPKSELYTHSIRK